MKRSIVLQLWASVAAVLLLVLVVFGFAADQMVLGFFYRYRVAQLVDHGRWIAEILALDPFPDRSTMQSMSRTAQARVAVFYRSGSWVYIGFDHGHPSEAIAPERLRDTLPGGELAARDVIYGGERHFAVVVPVGSAENPVGWLLLMAPQRSVQDALRNLRGLMALAAAGAMLLTTALAFLLSRRVARPLILMQQATRAVGQGDYTVRLPVGGEDEVGQLGAGINRMSDALDRYERTRREFFANVSHELRTPLSHIRGYSQALEEGIVETPEEQARYFRVIRREAERLGRLVEDLMDLAQLEEGKLTLHREAVDLHGLAAGAASQVAPRAEAGGISLEVDVAADLPPADGDPARLEQVLINLLDNALRHTPPGGRVTVTGRRAGDGGLELAVADTGEGIPPADLPLIFDRFHRVDRSRAQPAGGGGRGLGLAIVRSILRAHGGDVWAESTPGQGTTIRCRLPAAEP